MNVALVFPAATMTVAGTVATVVSELFNATDKPVDGAGPLSVTAPVTTVVELPCTLVGLRVRDSSVAGVMVSVACWVLLPRVARIAALA